MYELDGIAPSMKTILITGSNKGIGFETARQLGKLGHRVVISGRDQQRVDEAIEKLAKEMIVADQLVMDVSEMGSIESAATELSKRKIKIDVLINNAAISSKADRQLLQQDESVMWDTLTANGVGPLRTVKAFLSFLNKSARIINVSSGGGSMTDPVGGWSPAYCASKTLLNAITRHLASELSDKNISVNAVCPGWVKTDMGGQAATRTVEKGAETIVWLATADSVPTGKFFRDRKIIPW